LAKLAHSMALSAVKISGVSRASAALVVPMATGMAISLTLRSLFYHIGKENVKYVVWTRVDQKSALKAIFLAGFIPIVVENKIEGDAVVTDLEGVKKAIENVGKEKVLCVLSTTSAFAPRAPDKIEEIGRLCKDIEIGHIVNNAYGLQSYALTEKINRGCVFRVDAFIQSTDKNFMVLFFFF